MVQKEEYIVFVDEQGNPTGETGPKLASHHSNTKLHLAFSCYVFNRDGNLLLTRRADSKKVWPGVWTNSFCGHPMPGEKMEAAIRRRAQQELGLTINNIECMLPQYRYKAPAYNDIVENEFCPVYVARAASQVQPNPDEVAEYQWVNWVDYVTKMRRARDEFSYWAKDQYPKLNNSPSFNMFLAGLSAPA